MTNRLVTHSEDVLSLKIPFIRSDEETDSYLDAVTELNDKFPGFVSQRIGDKGYTTDGDEKRPRTHYAPALVYTDSESFPLSKPEYREQFRESIKGGGCVLAYYGKAGVVGFDCDGSKDMNPEQQVDHILKILGKERKEVLILPSWSYHKKNSVHLVVKADKDVCDLDETVTWAEDQHFLAAKQRAYLPWDNAQKLREYVMKVECEPISIGDISRLDISTDKESPHNRTKSYSEPEHVGLIQEIKSKYSMQDCLRDLFGISVEVGDNFKCPFHDSKSGTCMHLYEDNIAHCFHCGLRFDIFDIYMKEKCASFSDARRDLAEKAGVELPDFKDNGTVNRVVDEEESSRDVGSYIILNDLGPVKSFSHQYVEEGLKHLGLKPRLNILTGEWELKDPEKKILKSGEWDVFSDSLLEREFQIRFRREVQGKDGHYKIVGLQLTKYQIKDAIEALAEDNSYNPLHEYLEAIYKVYSGWKEHLEGEVKEIVDKDFISELFNVECEGDSHHAINLWAGKAIFRQLVQRGLFPGCEINSWVVLQGGEGIGKSSSVKEHLPVSLRTKLYSDNFDFRLDEEKKVRSVRQILLLEAGESVGFRKADQNSIKSFINATHDRDRRLRKDKAVMRPRGTVFVLTGNHDDFLSAEEQNRRFVTIKIKGAAKISPKIWFKAKPLQDCELSNRDFQYCGVIDELIKSEWISFDGENLIFDSGSKVDESIVGDFPRELWGENMDIARQNTNASDTYMHLIEEAEKSGRLNGSDKYLSTEILSILADMQYKLDCDEVGEASGEKERDARIRILERFQTRLQTREINKALKSIGWKNKTGRKKGWKKVKKLWSKEK